MNLDQELRRLASDLQRPQRCWSDADRAMGDAAYSALMAYVPAGRQLHDLDVSTVPTEVLREVLRVCRRLSPESGEPWIG